MSLLPTEVSELTDKNGQKEGGGVFLRIQVTSYKKVLLLYRAGTAVRRMEN